MLIYIDGVLRDAEQEPIVCVLTGSDKKNIRDMLPECSLYGVFPSSWSEDRMNALLTCVQRMVDERTEDGRENR